MADYAPNYTPRYKVRYTTLGATHTMQFRVGRGTTDFTGIAGKVSSFLEELSTQLFSDWTVVSAQGALEDSDVFLPAPLPSFTPSTNVPPGLTSVPRPVSISFPGRSTAGLRAILFVYGSTFFPSTGASLYADYRITSAENATIAASVTALSELAPVLVANDNETVVWYDYANLTLNDYWLRRVRAG
jgi:hypothetical protein